MVPEIRFEGFFSLLQDQSLGMRVSDFGVWVLHASKTEVVKLPPAMCTV